MTTGRVCRGGEREERAAGDSGTVLRSGCDIVVSPGGGDSGQDNQPW